MHTLIGQIEKKNQRGRDKKNCKYKILSTGTTICEGSHHERTRKIVDTGMERAKWKVYSSST